MKNETEKLRAELAKDRITTMSRFDKAKEAIRNVHANTRESLDAVRDQLEELSALADELAEAIAADIDAAS